MMILSRRLIPVAAIALLSGMLLSGCPGASFQVWFQNAGDYPVVGVFIQPNAVNEDAPNLIQAEVPAGNQILLGSYFPTGFVYEAITVFDVNGTLVAVGPQMIDTSALGGAYVTYYALYRTDGSTGSGYNYGQP
jgi:hypothetical protein